MYFIIDTVSKKSRIILKTNHITNSVIIPFNNKIQISESIISKLLKLFKKDFNLEKIETIAVCTGPGSFTGLRIGIAAAVGLRAIIDAKICGFGSFEILLEYSRLNYSYQNVHILVQSSNDQNFYAAFDEKNNYIIKPHKIENLMNIREKNPNSILISNHKINKYNKNYSYVTYKEIDKVFCSDNLSIFSKKEQVIEATYL